MTRPLQNCWPFILAQLAGGSTGVRIPGYNFANDKIVLIYCFFTIDQLFVLSTELPVKAVEMTKLNKELAKAGFTAQGIAYLIKPNTYNCQA